MRKERKVLLWGGVSNLDFWKMLLTFGVWSSVSDGGVVIKDMKMSGDGFTFTSMLETDPEEWDGLKGYEDFVGKYVIFDADTGTLTLRNINVTGKWVAHDYSFLHGSYYYWNGWRCIDLNKDFKHIIMEDTVSLPGNYIGSFAFVNCSYLKSIVIPKTVESIGGETYNKNGNVVTFYGDTVTEPFDAFFHCTSLAFVTISKSCSIGDWAFAYCNSLTTINIPQGCSIGDAAFAYCDSLTTINIPQGCSIGNSAFDYCTSLTTINIPQGCSIGNNAFYNCNSLTTINIPQGCSIGYGAFAYCNSLKYVITTDNIIKNNRSTIFTESTSINESITDTSTTYYIYTISDDHEVKYAESDESTQLISIPSAIEPYVTNLKNNFITTDSGTTKLESSKLYKFTLSNTDSVSATSKIKITAYEIYN